MFLFLFLVVLFSGPAGAQQKEAASPFFFIQMTDPQFGFFSDNKGFEQEIQQYRQAVDAVNRLEPDFLVITGDFVNNPSDSLQWAEFGRLTAAIKASVPVYLSPGNHDIGQHPTKKTIRAYESVYGDDKFSFKHQGHLFIGINTCLLRAKNSRMEQKQLKWLKKQLKRAEKTGHTIIFTHYPFFLYDPEEPESYSNIPPEKRKKYLDLFRKHGVDYIFAGHYHNNASGNYGPLQMITTGPVGRPLGDVPSGFRIVKVFKNQIEHRYYGLKEVPETVSLEQQ